MRRVASIIGSLLIAATIAGLSTVVQAAEGPAALPPSVRIKPVMVPIVTRGQVERYTQIEVMLEVANATRLGEVQVAIPRLHDAALRAVYLGIEEGWIVRGNIANMPALRRKIDEESVKLFGKDVVSRILITPLSRQSSFP
ncbi:hypothetical protein ABAZ39_05860 [Azospirillum argentinense]|uniref:Flagellar basal body-associated FliL family protein n=1 Tax=Azospirillum argentinense TaxID=2970906 RepID=A0A2K1G7H6_9PROT|nr:hypothetical protein [Azospirillum argentinense]AIB11542.1 hypothetical protein ABAZ39_05860 [Azospirillum argentinense]EZQ08454.1 hypothetical protein ABAZ39_07300 [Azospirillum argentinense]KAA1058868.1 hypothetical protein FH063_001068 [Azospirillum argentinense]MBK3799921.1 hypothetical protein [Azospirillum argentinense]PNR00746.1 hypothetical protein C1S70_01150 [Azospirillum argentinense]